VATEWHVTWSDEARQDLDEIVDYIADDSPTTAQDVFDKVVARVGSRKRTAGRGRLVPEVTISVEPPLRELIEGPWRIMYAIAEGQVVIAAIVDGRRDIQAFLRERFDWPADN